MKRFAVLLVMALMSFSAMAGSIRYFTRSQADRTVRHLNAQNEVMIYCGYDYEIETYVLVNEVWAERVNSAYYELWIYGYDAYTGEEIYMPLDLECVWLYSAGHIYNAAQYLRFHASVRMPSFAWSIPAYNAYTRVMHRPGYRRTYHYDVHVYGWMPPAPHAHGHGYGATPPMHPYYMRQPNTPAPRPTNTWTPGVDRPQVSAPDAAGRTASPRTGTTTTVNTSEGSRNNGAAVSPRGGESSSSRNTGTANTSNSRNSGTSATAGSRNTGTGSATRTNGTETRNTSTTPTRTNTGSRVESGASKTSGEVREVSSDRSTTQTGRKNDSGKQTVKSSNDKDTPSTGARTVGSGSRNGSKATSTTTRKSAEADAESTGNRNAGARTSGGNRSTPNTNRR